MKNEVMVDNETLGTGPRSVILIVGLRKFNNDGPTDPGIRVALDIDQQIAGGSDGTQSTLLWWMKQSEEARKVAFTEIGRLRLPEAYSVIRQYLKGVEEFWFKGPQFDAVQLEHVFRGAPEPLWPHTAVNDSRTLCKEAGMPYNWPGPDGWEGVPHDPLSDCSFQIEAVLEARRRIKAGIVGSALEPYAV